MMTLSVALREAADGISQIELVRSVDVGRLYSTKSRLPYARCQKSAVICAPTSTSGSADSSHPRNRLWEVYSL
jgi:hypothetical protein